MVFLYTFFIRFYWCLLHVVALFNAKAKLFVNGRKDWLVKLKTELEEGEYIWFHCASLGEFEQGRPVIEAIYASYPTYKIIVTFFSPSGFEVRKNYSKAQIVMYLPLDTPYNAKEFLEVVKPKAVFFVKYEFWHHYLNEVSKRGIPLFLVSGIFRANQVQFKWYGIFFLRTLKKFQHFFLQDTTSEELLRNKGLLNTSVSGDTRFDRVVQTLSESKNYPLIEHFLNGKECVVFGSSWSEDLNVYQSFVNDTLNYKYIIAPHEIGESTLVEIEKRMVKKTIRYTSITSEMDLKEYDVLILDTIGMLANVYTYASITYVGGAFGSGLHNILEAATFGKPIVFGPKYLKFKEARDLVHLGGAISVKNELEFIAAMTLLLNKEKRDEVGQICSNYTIKNQGATAHVLRFVQEKNIL